MSSSVQAAPPAAPLFWNDTPFKTYLFDAFSVLLPVGEGFVIAAVEAAAATLPHHTPLQDSCRKFIAEEQAHQRAHQLYNQRLTLQGYPVQALEQRIASDLTSFSKHLSVNQRLCLAGAFEHITSVISRAALHDTRGWLSTHNSPQVRLWRWHCAEEIAHAHVTLDLMQACGVSGLQRLGFYLLASLLLGVDILLHVRTFDRIDKARTPRQPAGLWLSASAFLGKGKRAMQMAPAWASYFLPLRVLTRPPVMPASAVAACPPRDLVKTRFLQAADIPALLALEHKKWEPGQAATADEMSARIARYPQLCLGAFDASTGEALASMFMKPTSQELLMQSANWQECARTHAEETGMELFGISFSSIHPEAGDALFEFFWPHALKAGWRHIYLGSPLPGFKKWLGRHPGGSVYRYVHSGRRAGSRGTVLPLDPQLRYYRQRGFRKIMYIRPDYFPHEESLDYGVLIRGTVPLSLGSPLWRRLPVSWLNVLKKSLFVLL